MSLRPPLHVSTFHSRTVVSMFGRLCHLLVHALSSLQVANAQCMTLRSLAPCLRAAREKHRFAAGKNSGTQKSTFGSSLAAGKSCFRSGKKRQQKMPLRSGKKPSEAGKNPSEARKKPAEAGKKTAAEKVQLCNPKSCRIGKNTFPQVEYVRHAVETFSHEQQPQQHTAWNNSAADFTSVLRSQPPSIETSPAPKQ